MVTREPFWYLASPYNGHPYGLEAAFQEASRVAGDLVGRGIRVFCPIAHCYPLELYGGLSGTSGDLKFWLGVDGPMMDAAVGLIVLKMKGWTESEGIKAEVKRFREAEKPVLYMEWKDD